MATTNVTGGYNQYTQRQYTQYSSNLGSIFNSSIPSISIDENLVKFIELMFLCMGYEITYEKFSKMTDAEKNSIFREFKLNNILKDGI